MGQLCWDGGLNVVGKLSSSDSVRMNPTVRIQKAQGHAEAQAQPQPQPNPAIAFSHEIWISSCSVYSNGFFDILFENDLNIID